MFSLATTLLSKIASPAFEEAYARIRSIRKAKDELRKLVETIETIKDVLLDAEEQQESKGVAVKNWIKRVRDVMYDADDLFDEVSTDDMLKQQITKQEGKFRGKVKTFISDLNPVTSRDSIAMKVKAIRKRLVDISTDTVMVNFVIRRYEEPISGVIQRGDQGSFIDSKEVFGRDDEKKTILEMLLHDQSNDVVSVIAVIGIGGMGKTTFAQLVYNDEKVQNNFANRWFACISDTSDDREIIGKIFQSVCDEQNYGGFNLSQLQERIRGSVGGKKFLLVLDDVWDDDCGRWIKRMSLLSGCAKGSKIIVTTRSLSVASAMGSGEAHTLKLDGLSADDSWGLFRRVALTSKQEADDPRWAKLGREIVKKCTNVPLAIISIGSLLCKKATIQEWESFKNEELIKLGESGRDPIMAVLKLSYDHLNSSVKQCFAYCSLFPKDYIFRKCDLIYLWIAQGYIKSDSNMQNVDDVGHSYFMDLFRMCFFQEAIYDRWGEIESCKMHDLIHDLAQKVAAEETIQLTTSATEIKGTPRHAYVGCVAGDSMADLALLLNGNRLRSFIYEIGSTRRLVLDQEFTRLKFLRTLKLSSLGIENIPSSIGELKLLRYLDLSWNEFKRLPDSVTKLLNLCFLDLSRCYCLEALPIDLGKLINLRDLKIMDCDNLRCVPPGFKELNSLQHLDYFNVGQMNEMADLFGLKISGELKVQFGNDLDDADWIGIECWKPPFGLKRLEITGYKGTRIPRWANGRSADEGSSLLPNLTSLSVWGCDRLKCLPPFRHLPNLNFLELALMDELEYVEEEEEKGGKQNLTAASNALNLPVLKKLRLVHLSKLKGWSRKVEATTTRKGSVTANGEELSSTSASACDQLPSFPSLSTLDIDYCENLKYIPLCPSLRFLDLRHVDAKVIPPLLSIHDPTSPYTTTSSTLERVGLFECDELTSFPGHSLTRLRHLQLNECWSMKIVELPPSHLNILEDLHIRSCFELEDSLFSDMWEEENTGMDWDSLPNLCTLKIDEIPSPKRGVDWDSLPNLRRLIIDRIPSPERLPDCLRNLQSLGKLRITDC